MRHHVEVKRWLDALFVDESSKEPPSKLGNSDSMMSNVMSASFVDRSSTLTRVQNQSSQYLKADDEYFKQTPNEN